MRGKTGRAEREEVEADAAFWGLTLPEADGRDTGDLWADHMPALAAFIAVSDQWRTASVGMAGLLWLGLDDAGAKAGLEMSGIAVTPAVWRQLKLIEAGAREELNRRG